MDFGEGGALLQLWLGSAEDRGMERGHSISVYIETSGGQRLDCSVNSGC